MIGVDSNLLLRMILDDDPTQSAIVERVYGSAGNNGGIYVSLIVLAELAWVLKRGYKEKPEEILNIIDDLLAAREFTVEQPELVRSALSDARGAHCGIADAIIARVNEKAGTEMTLTFDVRAKRLPTMRDAAAYR